MLTYFSLYVRLQEANEDVICIRELMHNFMKIVLSLAIVNFLRTEAMPIDTVTSCGHRIMDNPCCEQVC